MRRRGGKNESMEAVGLFMLWVVVLMIGVFIVIGIVSIAISYPVISTGALALALAIAIAITWQYSRAMNEPSPMLKKEHETLEAFADQASSIPISKWPSQNAQRRFKRDVKKLLIDLKARIPQKTGTEAIYLEITFIIGAHYDASSDTIIWNYQAESDGKKGDAYQFANWAYVKLSSRSNCEEEAHDALWSLLDLWGP